MATDKGTVERIQCALAKKSHEEMHGILLLTVMRNRATDFYSVIADLDTGETYPLYPAPLEGGHHDYKIGDLYVCYRPGLDKTPLSEMSSGRIESRHCTENPQSPAFCCSAVYVYRSCPTNRDAMFADFLKGTGHHPNVIYGVRRQVNQGPLISTVRMSSAFTLV